LTCTNFFSRNYFFDPFFLLLFLTVTFDCLTFVPFDYCLLCLLGEW